MADFAVTWISGSGPSTSDPVRIAHERAMYGTCSHGGHGYDASDTCSDLDDAIAAQCRAEQGDPVTGSGS